MATWYLWVVNAHPRTNEWMAQMVAQWRPEDVLERVLCADDEHRALYRCKNYSEVRCAIAAKEAHGLRFEVYQTSRDGRPTRYDLWKQGIRRKSREIRTLGTTRV